MARRRGADNQQDNQQDNQGQDKIDFNVAPKQATALRLRRLGYTYDQIAAKIGLHTASGVRKLVIRAERNIVRDEARELVNWQLDRIDMALQVVMEAVEAKGKSALWAVDRLAPLLKRQAELMGIDAPKPEANPQPVTVVREVYPSAWVEGFAPRPVASPQEARQEANRDE